MIFRLFEKSQTHSICNFKKPCLLECQPKMLKAFSAKHETKHCFVKANISFIKIWARKNQYVPERKKYMGRQTECQEMIHFLLSRLGLNGNHLMLSSSIFTGSRSSGSIWKTQQRQGNSWEGNWKGSKGARVVRLRLRFRRPVRIWGQWYQVKILTNNCFPFLWYSDILVWLFVQSSEKKTNKYSSDILMQYVAS